jgi:hypothetical protein
MLAYSEHRRGENEKAQGYLLEAFMMGRGILATITSWIAIPIFAMMLADSGEFERAIELFAFVSRYPMISKSRLVDIFKPSILIAESRLQKENVAEAQARSQARNLRDTIAEIIKELENALDN